MPVPFLGSCPLPALGNYEERRAKPLLVNVCLSHMVGINHSHSSRFPPILAILRFHACDYIEQVSSKEGLVNRRVTSSSCGPVVERIGFLF